jgi:glycerate kinase
MVAELDAALAHYAEVIQRDLGLAVADIPGAGAAGGLGPPCVLAPRSFWKPYTLKSASMGQTL